MSLLGAVLALVRALPDRPASLFSRTITVAYLALRPAYRREIRRNVALVLGQDRPWFWVRNGWRVGGNIALMVRMGQRLGQAIIDSASVHCDNTVKMTLERELHTTAVSFHFGLWECLPQVLEREGLAVTLAIGAQRDSTLQAQLLRLRTSGHTRIARSLRQVVRPAGGRTVTGFMLDNTSQGTPVFALAEGISVRMPDIGFRIAARRGVGVVPMFARLERGRLRVTILPPTDADGVALALLSQVRSHPEDWIWWAKAGALTSAEKKAA